MNLYLDTSALVKNYIDEVGSPGVRSMIENPGNQIWVSELAETEFTCALFRRLRNHELSADLVSDALDGFRESIKKFELLQLTSGILNKANHLINDHAGHFPLRTLDAMHAATFISIAEKRNWSFVTADIALGKFIEHLGFEVISRL
jgi:predicted nucleic acid-binding protein